MSAYMPWIAIAGIGVGLLALAISVLLWRSLGTARTRTAQLEKALAKAIRRQRKFEDTILPPREEELTQPPRSLAEVLTEVRILQNLVEQLYQEHPDAAAFQQEGELGSHEPTQPDVIPDKPGPTTTTSAHPPKSHDRPQPGAAEVLAQIQHDDSTAPPLPSPRKIAEDDNRIVAIVKDALKKDRVELNVQPIVLLPARRPRHYECFSRIRDPNGDLLAPKDFLPQVERAGLIGSIDNMTLFRLVQLIRRSRKIHAESRFFCNISQVSLANETFISQFIDYLSENASLAQLVVFEFNQRDFQAGNIRAAESIQRLAELGYRFSLDQIEDLDIDPEAMARFGFKYVKMDAKRLLEYVNHEPPLLDVSILKGELDRNAMDLIVDKIETEAVMRELLDHPIDFGQGYLFGEPKPVGS